jgi:hypothetical protein
LERKAKLIAIKKLNKRKKEETKKEEMNEDDEFEKIILRSANGQKL